MASHMCRVKAAFVVSVAVTAAMVIGVSILTLLQTTDDFSVSRDQAFRVQHHRLSNCSTPDGRPMVTTAFSTVSRDQAFRVQDHHLSNCSTPDGRPLVTVTLNGRLGNNMFQYAALLGIAKKNNMTPVLGSAVLKQEGHLYATFPHIPLPVCKIPAGWSVVKYIAVKNAGLYLGDQPPNTNITGWFSGWSFFQEVKEIVREHFVFAEQSQTQARDFLRKMASGVKQPVTFVGIHVRRGDYLSEESQDLGYAVSNATYIARAMRYYEDKYTNNIVFVVCSEDQKWTRRNVKSKSSKVVFSEFINGGQDLCLLSMCNHTILTHGTFGWWGGWLAGGEVVFDMEKSRGAVGTDAVAKRYPAHWITVINGKKMWSPIWD